MNRKKKIATKRNIPNHLSQLNPNVAGIDIGCHSHFVAAPIASGEIEVQEFCSTTSGLESLADWLKVCQVTSVATESTGVY